MKNIKHLNQGRSMEPNIRQSPRDTIRNTKRRPRNAFFRKEGVSIASVSIVGDSGGGPECSNFIAVWRVRIATSGERQGCEYQ